MTRTIRAVAAALMVAGCASQQLSAQGGPPPGGAPNPNRPPQKSRTAVARLKGWKIIHGGLGMGKVLTSLAFVAAMLALASSEASAMNFLCQAVGPRSVAYGRAFFAADAKWQALLRCERRSGICIISYCVPTN